MTFLTNENTLQLSKADVEVAIEYWLNNCIFKEPVMVMDTDPYDNDGRTLVHAGMSVEIAPGGSDEDQA